MLQSGRRFRLDSWEEDLKYQPGALQRIRDVEVDESTVIGDFVNLYECRIGAETTVGSFVEIGKTVIIGKRCKIGKTVIIGKRCKISSHANICPGVTIEDDVFVGERVSFINDRFPRATNSSGAPATEADWILSPTTIKCGAFIGAGTAIMGALTIGERARIAPGSVVTRDVPDGAIVAGNPAREV